MKIFNITSSGFVHWALQRSSALILICSLFTFFFFQSLYLSHLILIVLVLHFKLGFETLIEDYVHYSILKTFAKISLRLVGIYILKCIFFVSIII